ncbi:hypothetical protein KFU94_34445 [Chloroflexi bacterium TSY]|nr:hypothetical protein [Chloroflexi bacterium TSY]MBV7333248.1 hypothetical protein [Chloroflexi bacterium TSY]
MTTQNDDPKTIIAAYHNGFIINSPQMLLSTLAQQFIMVNGNYSGEPTDWQAHLFLAGNELEAWPALFIQEAGPYKNQFEVLHVDIRGKAAVVVTKDTGRNRFRTWEDEIVTWFLGQYDREWKITGLFIRDLKNPE